MLITISTVELTSTNLLFYTVLGSPIFLEKSSSSIAILSEFFHLMIFKNLNKLSRIIIGYNNGNSKIDRIFFKK
jgi:hypothetical protein